MNLLMDEENPLQNSTFITKTFRKIGLKGVCGNTYKETIANVVLNGERLDDFPLRLGMRQGFLLLSFFFFNLVLKVLAGAIRQKRKI